MPKAKVHKSGKPIPIGEDLNFVEYHRVRSPIRNVPTAGIQRTGRISLNQAAYEALGRSDRVSLRYAPAAGVIGIRRAGQGQLKVYRLVQQAASSIYLIAGGPFLRHFGIPAITRRYPAELVGDTLCFRPDTEATEGAREQGGGP